MADIIPDVPAPAVPTVKGPGFFASYWWIFAIMFAVVVFILYRAKQKEKNKALADARQPAQVLPIRPNADDGK